MESVKEKCKNLNNEKAKISAQSAISKCLLKNINENFGLANLTEPIKLMN